MKKKIVIFIGGYLPAQKYGGPVTSIANLVENLGDSYDFWIISNNHEYKDNKPLKGINPGWNSVGKAKVMYLSESEFQFDRFFAILNEIKADVVYLSSIFYLPNQKFLKAAKKVKSKIIIAPRGELYDNAMEHGKVKKTLFLSFLRIVNVYRDVLFHATTVEEKKKIIQRLCIDNSRIFLMPNMHGKVVNRNIPSKKQGELKLVYLARIHEHKNLRNAIEAVIKSNSQVVFDIYGPVEQAEYWDSCKELMNKAPSNVTICYKGGLSPSEAKNIYKDYHCSILPTSSENFGHSICESLLCGCPVIISRGTTPWDDIEGVAGYTIPLSDISGYSSAIDLFANMDMNEYSMFVNQISGYLSIKLKTDELINEYRKMFD